MGNDKIDIATGVWFNLSYGHTKYHHFPCHMQYEHYCTSGHKYISALESCEPISSNTWGANYDTLNGAKPRLTSELRALTKCVCAGFLKDAGVFANMKLPMISMSMERLITGRTRYQGREEYVGIKQDNYHQSYNFIYSNVKYPVTPLNISEVLGKEIKRIHVVDILGTILWDQQSELDPNTSLYVYNCDEYEPDSVYVKILEPDIEVVNTNACLIHPESTRHVPAKMAALFRQKTAPIGYHTQSR